MRKPTGPWHVAHAICTNPMQRAALILCYLVGGSDQPTARDESMTTTKPYTIPKRLVWESYQRVKANRGASGIDEQTLEEFDKDLSKNLYKLWNRLSSGSYFPPPVKVVEIPMKEILRPSRNSGNTTSMTLSTP